jgi:hypothetical protein
MNPAGASPADADSSRSDDEKNALVKEYDEADYRGRYAMLDREQITIRHISRWRAETGGATLRVAGARTSPRPPRKRAATPQPVPLATPDLEPAPEPVAAKPAAAKPAAETAPATKPVVTKPAAKSAPAVTKAAPKRLRAPAARKTAATPAKPAPRTRKPPEPPARTAARRAPARPRKTAAVAPAAVRAPAARPATTPVTPPRRSRATAEAAADLPRRLRRRATSSDLAATALRDAALAHADQIVQHAEALKKLLADDGWQAVTAASGVAAPDREALTRQITSAERAAAVVRSQLAATGQQSVADRAPGSGPQRGRKPWWGATSS